MTYRTGPTLTSSQFQLVCGTILGGSSIIRPKKGRNCYLSMRGRDFEWLSYKTQELREFFKIDGETIRKDGSTFRCHTMAFPAFNDIYDRFYENGQKRVTSEILEPLNDTAWMVWFLDAGKKSKRKAYLRTQQFGMEGTALISEYFNSLDCECEIRDTKKRREIVFTNRGAFNYLRVVAGRLPLHLESRLGD